MAENRASGPLVGLMVIYTQTATNFYPALIVTVNAATGLVRLTTFPPGGTTADQQNVRSDETGTLANTWRFPDGLTGL